MDDAKIFHDITGLEASRLLEETFEFQLAAAEAAAASRPRRSNAGAIKSSAPPARGRLSVKGPRGGAFADRHDGAAEHPMQEHRSALPLND